MISSLTGHSFDTYSDPAPPPHLAIQDQPALKSASQILRTPELSAAVGLHFDQLDANSVANTLMSSPHPLPQDPASPADYHPSGVAAPSTSESLMHKSTSWRRKYASLIAGNPHTATESPTSSLDHSSGDSTESAPSTETGRNNVGSTSATGCYISAPLSPPVGYPMEGVSQPGRPPAQPEEDSRASVISSSSSGSSPAGSIKGPTPPQWAQPPKKTPSVRATSFDSGLTRPPVFNPEPVRGPAGELAEILRGEQGRIAIKSTPSQYEVLVWLPGFSINDITIVSRKGHVLHIVADQWDENDHAQWEIRLGDDAVMTTIRAQFSGSELKITVARSGTLTPSNMSVHSNVSMRSASSRAAPNLSGAPSGHALHERSFSTPTTAWCETDRRDLEARMDRGAEGF